MTDKERNIKDRDQLLAERYAKMAILIGLIKYATDGIQQVAGEIVNLNEQRDQDKP